MVAVNRAKGITCQHCGSEMGTSKTAHQSGRTTRVRYCLAPQCGGKAKTVEVPLARYLELIRAG